MSLRCYSWCRSASCRDDNEAEHARAPAPHILDNRALGVGSPLEPPRLEQSSRMNSSSNHLLHECYPQNTVQACRRALAKGGFWHVLGPLARDDDSANTPIKLGKSGLLSMRAGDTVELLLDTTGEHRPRLGTQGTVAVNVNMLTSYDVKMGRVYLECGGGCTCTPTTVELRTPERLTSTVQRTTLCVSRAAHCALRVRNMGRAEEGQGGSGTDTLSKVKLTGIEVAEPHEQAPACMAA